MKDITTKLDSVHGGAAGRAIINVAKTAARKGGEWLEKVGGWAGGAAALKEGWDWMRGGNSSPQQAPSTPQNAE